MTALDDEAALLGRFKQHARASFVVGGQWGSEGKGAAAAWVAARLADHGEAFDIVTTNAGAQAGHTSIHKGKRRVVYHLPTAPLIARDCGLPHVATYLNAGSIIDPVVLDRELSENDVNLNRFFIHPNAAVITDECRAAEMAPDSAQTRIASTRKGVGEALARKVLRSGMIASQHPQLRHYVRQLDLNGSMASGKSVLVEVPQGFSLGTNERFYPHCTSRSCTVQQGMADAGIHPSFYGAAMMVLRTYPIRVGNIEVAGIGTISSGSYYSDQHETSWEELGVPAEITTVTKRVRRVFTFSRQQLADAMCVTRPDLIYLAFVDYLRGSPAAEIEYLTCVHSVARMIGMDPPDIIWANGPSTDDARMTG